MGTILGRARWLLAAAVVAAAAAGVAIAQIPDSHGVIHGCYGPAAGYLRVVEAAADCGRLERPLDWAQQGPPAAAGGGGAAVAASELSRGTIGIPPGDLTQLAAVTVTFPAAGYALATVQAEFKANEADDFLSCAIADDTDQLLIAMDPGDVDLWYDQRQTATWYTPVDAGTATFTFACGLAGGDQAATVDSFNHQIIVQYFPDTLAH